METRILNEMHRYLDRIDAVHERVLGELVRNITAEQKNEIRAEFLTLIEEIIGLAKAGKDVHERFLQNVVLHSIDAIVGVDNDEKIFFWNRGAEMSFGFTQDEVVGKRFDTLFPPAILAEGELDRLREETYRVGYVRNFRTERVTKNGRIIQVSLSRTLLRDQSDQPLGYISVIRDITQMIELQRQVQHAEKLALVGQLATGIAHEVGTPLNVILGTTQLLMQIRPETDPEREDLETIVHQIERINRLIHQLLTYARPQKERWEEVSLAEQARAASSFLRGRLEGNSLELEIDFDPDIPPIHASRDEVQQVFLNLLVNACDACGEQMDHGVSRVSIRGRIEEGPGEGNRQITVEIRDTGCGVSPENLPFIFDPFYTTKDVGRGTGMGLAVSRRIVEDHGGSITVKSTRGEGTTFTILFPLPADS